MWIMTPFGILMPNMRPKDIIDADPEHRELQVRARHVQYLNAFRTRYCPELGKNEHHPDQDYPWKAPVSREALAAATARMVEDIDYQKFKPTTEDTAKSTPGKLYGLTGKKGKKLAKGLHNLYTSLWSTQLTYGDGTSSYDKAYVHKPMPQNCPKFGHWWPWPAAAGCKCRDCDKVITADELAKAKKQQGKSTAGYSTAGSKWNTKTKKWEDTTPARTVEKEWPPKEDRCGAAGHYWPSGRDTCIDCPEPRPADAGDGAYLSKPVSTTADDQTALDNPDVASYYQYPCGDCGEGYVDQQGMWRPHEDWCMSDEPCPGCKEPDSVRMHRFGCKLDPEGEEAAFTDWQAGEPATFGEDVIGMAVGERVAEDAEFTSEPWKPTTPDGWEHGRGEHGFAEPEDEPAAVVVPPWATTEAQWQYALRAAQAGAGTGTAQLALPAPPWRNRDMQSPPVSGGFSKCLACGAWSNGNVVYCPPCGAVKPYIPQQHDSWSPHKPELPGGKAPLVKWKPKPNRHPIRRHHKNGKGKAA